MYIKQRELGMLTPGRNQYFPNTETEGSDWNRETLQLKETEGQEMSRNAESAEKARSLHEGQWGAFGWRPKERGSGGISAWGLYKTHTAGQYQRL